MIIRRPKIFYKMMLQALELIFPDHGLVNYGFDVTHINKEYQLRKDYSSDYDCFDRFLKAHIFFMTNPLTRADTGLDGFSAPAVIGQLKDDSKVWRPLALKIELRREVYLFYWDIISHDDPRQIRMHVLPKPSKRYNSKETDLEVELF